MTRGDFFFFAFKALVVDCPLVQRDYLSLAFTHTHTFIHLLLPTSPTPPPTYLLAHYFSVLTICFLRSKSHRTATTTPTTTTTIRKSKQSSSKTLRPQTLLQLLLHPRRRSLALNSLLHHRTSRKNPRPPPKLCSSPWQSQKTENQC